MSNGGVNPDVCHVMRAVNNAKWPASRNRLIAAIKHVI